MDAQAMSLPVFGKDSKPIDDVVQRAIPMNTSVHPVEDLGKNFVKNDQQFREFALANVFGTHMPLRFKMEEKLLSDQHRLPPLHNEFLGRASAFGTDEDIGFEDFLNNPRDSEFSVDLHQWMETKLGL